MTSIAVVASACIGATGVPPSTVAADTNHVAVVQRVEGRHLILDVHDSRGIGGMAVETRGTALFNRITIVLHLAGLEYFELAWGDTCVKNEWSVQLGHAHQYVLDRARGDVAIAAADPRWIPRTNVNGSIRLEAPEAFLRGTNTAFSARWIDFYR